MASKKIWTQAEDLFLRANFHLTNDALSTHLKASASSIKKRYLDLGIDRPAGKNNLARLRNNIFREKLHGQVPPEWFDLPSTRADAKTANSPYYWDGQPCDRANHIAKRKTSSGGCWDCDYGDQKLKLSSDPEYRQRRLDKKASTYAENREEYLLKQRERKNTEQSRLWYRDYYKKKSQTDIEWKLSKSLRDRLYKAVSRDSKNMSALDLVGCTVEELKIHIEKQFIDEMSWENYGKWHIDHIRPCVSFDLTDPLQQKECFHYSNLRPIWGDENRSKGGIWNDFDPRKRSRKSPPASD